MSEHKVDLQNGCDKGDPSVLFRATTNCWIQGRVTHLTKAALKLLHVHVIQVFGVCPLSNQGHLHQSPSEVHGSSRIGLDRYGSSRYRYMFLADIFANTDIFE